MRPTALQFLTLIAAFSLPACSNASNASTNAADATAAAAANAADATSAASSVDSTATSTAAATNAPADGNAPPVYPGAMLSKKPELVAASSSPHAKAYVSPDDLAKVIAWYKAQLPNADEMSDPNDKTTDVFMMPDHKSGMVVVVQAYEGKTWIVIGPGFPQ